MLQNNRKFPADWPENCPPEDAVDANIEVFGCSKEFPPGKKDFKTAYEKNYKPDADPCLRRGLSVSITYEDAKKICEMFPRINKHIVSAQLTPGDGKIKKTKGPVPSHHTFWKYGNLSFLEIFRRNL
jgi:hypothetical protein